MRNITHITGIKITLGGCFFLLYNKRGSTRGHVDTALKPARLTQTRKKSDGHQMDTADTDIIYAILYNIYSVY